MTQLTPDDRRVIGEQIRRLRTARGLSQNTLARTAGISANTLGAIERGAVVQDLKLTAVTQALESRIVAADEGHILEDDLGEQSGSVKVQADTLYHVLVTWLSLLDDPSRDTAIRDLTRWMVERTADIARK